MSYDCLMENIISHDMRHAPLVQWASSGNVIRSCVFHGSDMHWHAGWTNENLYEDLIVGSSQVTGASGNGAWSSPPDDGPHGPNGPRNVIYNCEQKPADNRRHLDSWCSVKAFIDTALRNAAVGGVPRD